MWAAGISTTTVSVPVRRTLAKNWLKEHRGITDTEFLAVVGSLFRGKSHEEKTLASILLAYHSSGRKAVGPKQLNAWLNQLVGWAEINSALHCFQRRKRLLANRREWERFIAALARHKNINKRRAALVFLTRPLRNSEDKRLGELGFRTDRSAEVGTGDHHYQGRLLASSKHGHASQASGRSLHKRKSSLATRHCRPRDDQEDRDGTKVKRSKNIDLSRHPYTNCERKSGQQFVRPRFSASL